MTLMELVEKNKEENQKIVDYIIKVNDEFKTYPEKDQKEIIAIADSRFCGLDRAMTIFDIYQVGVS